MTILENDIFINQRKLHTVEHNLTETKKDIEYAMNQDDKLVCPCLLYTSDAADDS